MCNIISFHCFLYCRRWCSSDDAGDVLCSLHGRLIPQLRSLARTGSMCRQNSSAAPATMATRSGTAATAKDSATVESNPPLPPSP